MDGTVLALFSIKFKYTAAKIAFFCFPTKVLYIFFVQRILSVASGSVKLSLYLAFHS